MSEKPTFSTTWLKTEILEPRCLLSAYFLTDLGSLGGVGDTIANSINERGYIVGDARGVGSFNHPFLWTPTSPNGQIGVMTDLGLPPGEVFGTARDINEKGQIVGYAGNKAVLWDGETKILALAPGDTHGKAYAINNNGTIVGRSGGQVTGDGVVWRGDAPALQLATVGTKPTNVRNINNAGLIVGLTGVPINSQAAYWVGGYPTEIGTLDNNGSDGRDINEAGEIVGVSHIRDGNWILAHPFRYRPGIGIEDLGTLPCGPNDKSYGFASGMNNVGQIVGTQGCVNQSTFTGPDTAAIWDSINGWRNLQDLIPADSGWQVVHAKEINDRGQIIGYGFFNGNIDLYRSFLLTPNDRESPPDFRLPPTFFVESESTKEFAMTQIKPEATLVSHQAPTANTQPRNFEPTLVKSTRRAARLTARLGMELGTPHLANLNLLNSLDSR